MKTIRHIYTLSIKKTSLFMIVAATVLIGTQSVVGGTAAAVTMMNQDKQTAALIASASDEVQRRIDELKKSGEELEKATFISDKMKNDTIAENKAVQKTFTDLQQKLKGATSLADAQTQVKELEKLYASYQMSNVKTTSLTNSDSQTDAKNNLEKTAGTIKSDIGKAKSEGKDTANAEDMLAQITSLIVSVTAVIASVQALITSLIAGDIAGAVKIMENIVAQLGINSDVISSVSQSLGSLATITGSFNIGA
ncbi:MAG: hypothetical protein EOO17_04925 [Chloroflexi bacterium]|nr:MAG: hypothetical protein EOO17_04925 [Chloroflexota bacterium]